MWKEFIDKLKSDYWNTDGVYVTISKTKAYSSLNMFKKVWFKELYDIHNEFWEDNSYETHLYFPLSRDSIKSNWRLPLKSNFLKSIKSWTKVLEWRSWVSYFNYKVWDSVEFFNRKDNIVKVIKSVRRYSTLDDFLINEWIWKCLPGVWSINEARDIYNSLPGYKEKISEYWIVAFEF